MHIRRRRHQPAPALSLDNRPLGRTVRQTDCTHRISAFVRVNLQTVQGLQRHIHGVEIEFATGEVAHPALGASLMINFEGWHLSLLNRSPVKGSFAPRLLAPGLKPHRSALARTCNSPAWPPCTPSGTARLQTVYSRTPRRSVCPC